MDIGEETWSYDFEPMPADPAPVEVPIGVPEREAEPVPVLEPAPA